METTMDNRPSLLDDVKPLVTARTYTVREVTGEPDPDLPQSIDPFPPMVQLLDDGAPFTVDGDGVRRCYYCTAKENAGASAHRHRCPFGRMLRGYDAERERTVGAVADFVRAHRRHASDGPVFSKNDRNVAERLLRELTNRAADNLTAVLTLLYALSQSDVYRFDWPHDHISMIAEARARVDMVNRFVTPDGDTFAKDGDQ